jgi:hypothetical protein
MTYQSTGMPAKDNVKDLDYFVSGSPIKTDTTPYRFYTVDGCGVETLFDISTLDFSLVILFNDCLQQEFTTTGGTLKKGTEAEDLNALWIDSPSLAVRPGIYSYIVTELAGSLEVISGTILIK